MASGDLSSDVTAYQFWEFLELSAEELDWVQEQIRHWSSAFSGV